MYRCLVDFDVVYFVPVVFSPPLLSSCCYDLPLDIDTMEWQLNDACNS